MICGLLNDGEERMWMFGIDLIGVVVVPLLLPLLWVMEI